jgi:hypothetical protein
MTTTTYDTFQSGGAASVMSLIRDMQEKRRQQGRTGEFDLGVLRELWMDQLWSKDQRLREQPPSNALAYALARPPQQF